MRRWLVNPTLLEWDQAIPWCDLAAQRDYETIRGLVRGIAVRGVPLGAVVFVLGFWLIGRIPHGPGPVPLSLQFMLAVPLLLLWVLLHAALHFGLLRPKPGRCMGVQLHARGIHLSREGRPAKVLGWSAFDAFDFGRSDGFEILKLRLRETWLSRRVGPRGIAALEYGSARVQPSAIREVLLDRGLYEEPLPESGV